jgi:hypothetical protein
MEEFMSQRFESVTIEFVIDLPENLTRHLKIRLFPKPTANCIWTELYCVQSKRP